MRKNDVVKIVYNYFKIFKLKILQMKQEKRRHIPQFCVDLGYTGTGFYYPDIERRFEGLKKFWNIVVLENVSFCTPYSDLIIYRFRIYEPVLNANNHRKNVEVLKEISVKTLLDFQHDFNVFSSCADNLVAVRIVGDIAEVAFARTSAGVDIVSRLNKPKFE